ncbi:hypothetical protein HK100_000098 [Physocladia obscura]|uniref:Mediator of RNA polymerase II transcription subunit 4 n=1 Tax=Physocladia obscura TaxID=109957 RepID=A0AAD5SZA1_9FUNG|nr:hypothetical protein HK100_000098 [Physocladia obscura]
MEFDLALAALDELYAVSTGIAGPDAQEEPDASSSSFTTTSTTIESSKIAFARVITAQNNLRDLLTRLQPQLAAHARLTSARAALTSATADIHALVTALKNAESALDRTLARAQRISPPAPQPTATTATTVDIPSIVGYARRLAKHSSAGGGGIGALPPIPQDAHMKRSMLFGTHRFDDAAAGTPADAADGADAAAGAVDVTEFLMEMDVSQLLDQNVGRNSGNAATAAAAVNASDLNGDGGDAVMAGGDDDEVLDLDL